MPVKCTDIDLVPVPRQGFEQKVFYVWFDAPIAYIAIAQEWAEREPGRDWRQWWWQADDVRHIQFLGKDNVPFHAVSFPATLLGSLEPWKTVDVIKGFHWLNYEGGKFSTSRKRGIFTDAALDELPADLWRWWLDLKKDKAADPPKAAVPVVPYDQALADATDRLEKGQASAALEIATRLIQQDPNRWDGYGIAGEARNT